MFLLLSEDKGTATIWLDLNTNLPQALSLCIEELGKMCQASKKNDLQWVTGVPFSNQTSQKREGIADGERPAAWQPLTLRLHWHLWNNTRMWNPPAIHQATSVNESRVTLSFPILNFTAWSTRKLRYLMTCKWEWGLQALSRLGWKDRYGESSDLILQNPPEWPLWGSWLLLLLLLLVPLLSPTAESFMTRNSLYLIHSSTYCSNSYINLMQIVCGEIFNEHLFHWENLHILTFKLPFPITC